MRDLILKIMMGVTAGDRPKAYTVAQMVKTLVDRGYIAEDQGPTVRETMIQAAFFRMIQIHPNGRFEVTNKGREYINGKMAPVELSKRATSAGKKRKRRRKAS